MWPFGRSKLNRILRNQEYLMSALSDLTDAVMAMSASIDSAIVVLSSVPTDNSPQLAILKDELTAAKGRLDAAVAAVSSPVT
jgi:hypothetical protein